MSILEGQNLLLRALEPEDLDFLLKIENNSDYWKVSGTQIPFSKYTLELYIRNAHRDIYDVKQQRFVIEKEHKAVGLIDLFDFDPKNNRAGIGIVIEKESRNQNLGTESLFILKNYAFSVLNLHQLYANISSENKPSQMLFEKVGFKPVGVKKDWNFFNGQYKDEILYQLIHQNVH